MDTRRVGMTLGLGGAPLSPLCSVLLGLPETFPLGEDQDKGTEVGFRKTLVTSVSDRK